MNFFCIDSLTLTKAIKRGGSMFIKEIMVAVSIFVILLVSAWWLNEQTKREYVDIEQVDPYNSTFEIQSVNIDTNGGPTLYKPFKAREYIRVHSKPSK